MDATWQGGYVQIAVKHLAIAVPVLWACEKLSHFGLLWELEVPESTTLTLEIMRWFDRLRQVCLFARGTEKWTISSIVACQIALTQVCWQTNCLTCSCCCRSEYADLQCLRTEWVWPGQSCVSGVQSTECEQTGSRDRRPYSCSRWPSAIHKQGDEENHTQFLQCILIRSSFLTNLKLCRITEVHVSQILCRTPPP